MKLIKQSCEVLQQEPSLHDVLKHIELCGRTCYKSEEKITPYSAVEFVDKLIKNNHNSVLEQGTIYICYDEDDGKRHPIFPENDLWTRINKINYNGHEIVSITTNLRRLLDTDNAWVLENIDYIERTPDHTPRISVKIITNRAIANEFVRHRLFSFTQSSTRYCNYSKNKFDNQVSFILPLWFYNIEEDNPNFERYKYYLQGCEDEYMSMIKKGFSPQQARGVLPLDTQTELIMTGFLDDWKAFFKLRCNKAAHPQAQEIANEIRNKVGCIYSLE